MLIGMAADHAGLELKRELMPALWLDGYDLIDYGAYLPDPHDDYPDTVLPLARAISMGTVGRGIAICATGTGMAIAANKLPGVRAVSVFLPFLARRGVEEDSLNLLCLGSWWLDRPRALEMVRAFLAAEPHVGSRRRGSVFSDATTCRSTSLRN